MARLWVLAVALALLLAGCGETRDTPSGGDGGSGAGTAAPGDSLVATATWCASIAGFGLFACVILAIMWPVSRRWTVPGAIACGITILIAPIFIWVGEHLELIALVVGVVALAAGGILVWRYRWIVELLFGRDLNDDGFVGVAPAADEPKQDDITPVSGHPALEAKLAETEKAEP